MAIPSLASTQENENAPVPTSEDQQFMGLTTLSEEELMGIEGNKLALYDAYYYVGVVRGVDGNYDKGIWKDMIILYDGNGNVYGIMDHNGNVYTDIDHDGQITSADVAIILIKQGYDSWSSINYAVMLFGSQNYLATAN